MMAGWFNIKLHNTMGVERKSVRRGGGLRRHSVLAWLRMWRVVQKVERAAGEHLRAYGLNYAQFDVLATWRERARTATGRPLACGHYLAEERPDETAAELARFFKSPG